MTTVELEKITPAPLAQSGREGLRVELRADGQLWATRGVAQWPVTVRRCFPWTEGGRFVSLRDAEDNEVALVTDPADLDATSRAALERALLEAGFVFQVTRVLSVEEEVEIRLWKVETRQGHRTFETRLDDWPQDVPGGGMLMRDVAGDLYHFAHPKEMDKKSKELLWAFVD